MLKSFITSFKLKNTYRVNSIIYSIRQFPFIKKILPTSLYQNKGLKIFGNIISILIEIGSIFLGKLIYIIIMITSLLPFYKTNQTDTFIHLFTFLTLCGGLMNTFMFNPSKDKYYAMIIMNMDSKKYTLSNYYYSLMKVIVGFLPFTIIFGLTFGIPLWLCILLPIFVVMVKMSISNYNLLDYKKNNKIRNENVPTKNIWIIIVILLLVSYGLPLLNVTINLSIFMIVFIIFLVTGIYSFISLNKFDDYKKVYRQILTPDIVYMATSDNSTKMLKESVSKQIEFDKKSTSDKKGFSYFHELFMKRHSKILTKAVYKQSIIILIIFVIAVMAIVVNPNISKDINGILLMYLPYFVFVMYLLNRGTTVTQAMFMNCDYSMLTYRIYRTPKVILGLFKERLKSLIKINLIPAFIIGSCLSILLLITGGTDNILNYFVLFISIMAMSIFFSVHYLVMYYLLQPYNVSTEMKSSTYSVIQSLTYVVCYYMIRVKLPTISFGLVMILFSVLYSVVSLYLVYKYAHKTFKLRV